MKIRSKLAWTFIILLIGGITAVSSYSILFIRNYLLQEGLVELRKDTRRLAVTISHLPADNKFKTNLREIAQTVEYQIAIYDSTGALMNSYPEDYLASLYLDSNSIVVLKAREGLPQIVEADKKEKLVSTVYLPQSANAVAFIKLSQFKDNIYHPIQKIRWIIYYGMFISIGLIIIVSIWMARYLTQPITQIKDTAQAIAGGEVNRKIDLNRNDEFGDLATSLNKMADKFRWDHEEIKKYANKQQQFFADITHEIRNPLHTISASLEMLQMDNLTDNKRKNYQNNARSQVERLARLFKDLKTLQRYDSDEDFVHPKSFNLSLIGRHMQDWYAERAANKGLILTIDTHSCEAFGDPGKIEQVIDNLVSNAVKYTNNGTVTLSYYAENGNTVVEVRDTGPGIDNKHLEQLFDRFYRTDEARSRNKGGTGLGLSVVKNILNAHATTIHVESTPGEGAKFWFKLKNGLSPKNP